MDQTRNYLREKILTSLLLVTLVVFFSKDVIGHHIIDEESLVNKEVNVNEKRFKVVNDTFPDQNQSISIQRKTDDQDVKMSMENGKITELEVDGKKIDEKDYDKYQDIIHDVTPKGKSNMFFFGDGKFDFEDHRDIDSLMHSFDFKSFGNLKMDQKQLQNEMKKLQEQLGKMQFNFEGFDSIHFYFDDLVMPDMEMLKNQPDMKFFHFEDDDFPTLEKEFYFDSRENEGLPQTFKEFKTDSNFSESIGNALNRDGLLIPNQENVVELTGKFLKINGEKQPSNIWHKYKRIFEEQSGTVLQKNSRLEFKFEGKESKRKYRVY